MQTLSEYQIRRRATDQSFNRGEDYYAAGAVGKIVIRDNTIEAYVEGSRNTPYHVTVMLEDGQVVAASCTCPYDGQGDCKHTVAVLLTHIRPHSAPMPSIDERLAQMSADQLRELVHTLRSQKPELESWLKVILPSIAPVTTSDPAQAGNPVSVDTRTFRRQVQQAVDRLDYRNHWESIWHVVGGLEDAQAQARTYLVQGDFNNALALMRIIGEEVAPQYGELEEECQLADFLEVWSAELTEAILGSDLSSDERQTLSEELDEWLVELSDYGLDETLDAPITACVQGWENAAAENAIDLTDAKLNVIAYTGDTDRYLAWCLEQNAHYRYALRLTEVGRVAEAVTHVRQHPLRVRPHEYEDEYLKLGRFLYDQEHVEAAYQVGMLGLEHQDAPGATLTAWLAKLAEETERPETAFRAWQMTFEHSPSLDSYKALKRLASEAQWATLHPQLIEHVAATPRKDILIEILIEEQYIDRIIQVWQDYAYGGYQLREKVVDATASVYPDWAVAQALTEARHLIGRGSKHYPKATHWLGKIKLIYLQHEREADWQQCVAQIRAEHGRKYALMGHLK
jgi:uncharacterized Zn finger protein